MITLLSDSGQGVPPPISSRSNVPTTMNLVPQVRDLCPLFLRLPKEVKTNTLHKMSYILAKSKMWTSANPMVTKILL